MKLFKLTLVIVLAIALGGLGIGVVLWQKKPFSGSPLGAPIASPSSAPTKLLLWTDPAGFTFQYPEGVRLNKHDEDSTNYAHIEFTSIGHPGGLIVWAKDTNASDLNSWIKSDKRFASANILDTTFAGKPGKKIFIATPSSMLVTGTIDDSILFTVEAALVDRDYWSKVSDTIAASFTFTPENLGKTTPSSSNNASGGDAAVDEEETVE